MKSAVAIGGASALSAVLSVEAGADDPASMPYPDGDPSNRPRRQHLWSPVGRQDEFGNPAAPMHQVVLLFDYVGDDIDDDHIDGGIKDGAPLSMGFDSVYSDSIPSEQKVTITEGPWKDGTVAMVSKLRLELEDWYEDRTEAERIDEMFAPEYTEDDVGDFGEGLGKGSGRDDGEGWEKELTDQAEADAREKGVVGHSQKVTRARDDGFEVDLLRRDGDITIDGGKGGLSFVGLVEGISDWFDMGEKMYDPELDDILREHDDGEGKGRGKGNEKRGKPDRGSDGDEHHPRSGIAAQIDVRRRGHFLVPPRPLRSLPPA